ncbi:uncharacterized protein [Argopecten irradians]|uniref:uncharacterized protein n=1 Tax=Argopecten irradians TaxID=31199 RepID=UPI003717CA57
MESVLCSVACLVLQRTLVAIILYTNPSNNMPAKTRGKKNKDENSSEDTSTVPTRKSSRRKKAVLQKESPKSNRRTDPNKILKDSNDNEILHEDPKSLQKSKRTTELKHTELTDSRTSVTATTKTAPKEKNTKTKGSSVNIDTRVNEQTTNGIGLEIMSTMADKIAEKVVADLTKEVDLRPVLRRMDDMMKVLADLPKEKSELSTSAKGQEQMNVSITSDVQVQTIIWPTVDVHVQTTQKQQTQNEDVRNIESETSMLWENIMKQKKENRAMHTELHTTRKEFGEAKGKYQAALMCLLTSNSNKQYTTIVNRLSRETLDLDKLCDLVLEAKRKDSVGIKTEPNEPVEVA